MSQIEDNTSAMEMDPVEQLEDTKRKIQGEVAASKELVKNAKKKYRDLEKLKLEDHPDKPEKLKLQQAEIERYQQVLFEHEADFKELNRTRDDETEENVQGALNRVSEYIDCEPTAAYVIADDEFAFVTDYSSVAAKQNVQMRSMNPRQFIQLLSNDLNVKAWHLPSHRLIDLFNNKHRTFQLKRYSIDPSLWQQNKVYLPIRHMEQYFIDKINIPTDQELFVAESIEYFEWLMYSLSGGKKENQDHIEQWILHKILNYKKAVTTPDIVIVGHVGGNGKGIIQAIVRLMLPAILSGKANSKTLNGNFNAIMLGKLIVFFDDQNSKEIPLEVVKQLAGAETMIFEPKGKDQYEGEKTHSSAWFSQKPPFKLTPAGNEGGVDRRFSIMRTNITFLESIRYHYAEKGVTVGVEQSKDFAEGIVSNYLLNRLCIGGWFRHLQSKHPQVNNDFTLKPLHGDDYHYFLDQQLDSLDTVFRELVVPVVGSGGCVPVFVIKELMRHIDGYIGKDKTIHTRINELASQYKLDIVSEKTHIYITSGPSISTRKQCTVIHPAGIKNWSDKTFDWSLVSNTAYVGSVAAGQDLIKEDELVFGVRGDVDDDDLFASAADDADEDDADDDNSDTVWEQ